MKKELKYVKGFAPGKIEQNIELEDLITEDMTDEEIDQVVDQYVKELYMKRFVRYMMNLSSSNKE